MGHRPPHVEDTVRLTVDLPELFLRRGATGVVCSTWFAPTPAYEVEFNGAGPLEQVRALLLSGQVELSGEERPGYGET